MWGERDTPSALKGYPKWLAHFLQIFANERWGKWALGEMDIWYLKCPKRIPQVPWAHFPKHQFYLKVILPQIPIYFRANLPQVPIFHLPRCPFSQMPICPSVHFPKFPVSPTCIFVSVLINCHVPIISPNPHLPQCPITINLYLPKVPIYSGPHMPGCSFSQVPIICHKYSFSPSVNLPLVPIYFGADHHLPQMLIYFKSQFAIIPIHFNADFPFVSVAIFPKCPFAPVSTFTGAHLTQIFIFPMISISVPIICNCAHHFPKPTYAPEPICLKHNTFSKRPLSNTISKHVSSNAISNAVSQTPSLQAPSPCCEVAPPQLLNV